MSRLLLLFVGTAFAEVPMPVFPDCGPEGSCPTELNDDDEWYLLSWVPESSTDSIRPAEAAMGAGIAADQAFRTQTGDWSVSIAVLDSGIEWHSSDLINKVYLNVAELPVPQDNAGVDAASHDFDGNGLVNVRDYAEDPRVDITAGNWPSDHVLDASDLIATFSDGVDDDGNGYTDDISGWDFFAGDNDPWNTLTEGYGTHGTGVMRQAAGEGNGGGGDIGACPNCSILAVRTGDTFITDGNRAAQGVAFATDSGAGVVAMAMGALTQPGAVQDAFEYARANDVVLVAAAGDENSYHHNAPAMLPEALYVHSVHYEGANSEEAYSYLNFVNCNNYGPRTDLVAPNDGCATGSVAVISGMAGLLQSAALDRGETLSQDQIRGLLVASADDVWLTDEELEIAKTYPSKEGWDAFYGHGRVNLGRAVALVEAGQVPPAAWIDGLDWFEVIYPSRTPTRTVELDVDGGDWILELGQGWEPEVWTTVAEGSGASQQALDLDLSSIGLVKVPQGPRDETVLERVERVHAPAITLRLRAWTDPEIVNEVRRTAYLHEDPSLLDGFPYALGASGESSPQLADLDGDGVFEVVVASSNGEVLALRGDGSLVEGWPVLTDPSDRIPTEAAAYQGGGLDPDAADPVIATPAVGDLDGDGSPEVVVGTLEGRLHVWSATGEERPGFPVELVPRDPDEYDSTHTYDEGITGAPVLYDLDQDGTLEIIVAGLDSRLYAWDSDGALLENYPLEVCHPDNCGEVGARIITSPAIGDMDGDGDIEIAFGSNETLYDGRYSLTFVVDALTGLAEPGWPRQESGLVAAAAILPIIGTGHPASIALFDLDGDGDLEMFDPVMIGQNDILDHEGEIVREFGYVEGDFGANTSTNEPSWVSLSNNPAIGDMDGDGTPDVLIGGGGTYALVGLALSNYTDFQHVLGGFSGATGESLVGFPRYIEDFQFLVAPAIADVSGDGKPEAIYGSAGYLAHAWDADGNEAAGWPKFTGQWILGSPSVGDITGDGRLEVVVTTREGYVYAWSTDGDAGQDVQWAGIHHDAQNTGNFHTPLPSQAGVEAVDDERCGCRNKDSSAAFLFLLVPLFWRRRR